MSKRRANGEGTIYQRADGKWCAQYTAPSGVRKTIERKSQKEAREALATVKASILRSDYVEPSRLTVAAWLSEWLETYAPNGWEHVRTGDEIRDMFRLHILPYWEKKKTLLQKLTPAMCQAYVKHWKDMEYASATVIKRAKPLKAALEQAVNNGLIPKNPCTGWKLPKLTQDEIKFMNREQQTMLKNALPDTASARAIKLFLLTGLRVSELIALTWKDVQPDGLHIVRAAHVVDGQLHLEPPKSEAGWRVVPLSSQANELLEAQKAAQRKAFMRNRLVWTGKSAAHPDAWIFENATGGITDRAVLDRALNLAMQRSGIARVIDEPPAPPAWKRAQVKPIKAFIPNINKITTHPGGSKRTRIMMPDGTRQAIYGKDEADIRAKVEELAQSVNSGKWQLTAKKQPTKYEHWGLHTLRHTFATAMIAAGSDIKTLSVILGHADVAVTISLYVHSDAATKQTAINQMAAIFG